MSKEFVLSRGRELFDKRGNLLNWWQALAENFYPERADFTDNRTPGDEVSEGLATSAPILKRRDLGNALSSILRPTNKSWFHTRVEGWDTVGSDSRAWLSMTEERQRRAMYRRATHFSRATKEADHDFATFGQAVLQVSRNMFDNDLLFRTWHLRDCAWAENSEGTIETVYRKWKAPARDLKRLFGDKVHQEIDKCVDKEPDKKIEVWHAVMPMDIYKPTERPKRRYVSIYIDVANKHIMEEIQTDFFEYSIPRWQTVSGSQYAYSAATTAALADARTVQAMMITLLEAGEKAVTPPLLGVQGALRSDVNVMAGGLTWVDREYDERLGEVLRPLTVDKNGIPLGLDMSMDLRQQLHEAFFLDVLSLPPQDTQMTAYEVGHRVQEYIRRAMPLFEPIETEYNAPLCEKVFEILMSVGVFGRPDEMPAELQGRDVSFQFESPLHDAIERERVQQFFEGMQLIGTAAELDPSSIHTFDVPAASRDALLGSGMPEKWLRTKAEVKKRVEADKQSQQMAAQLEQLKTGSEAAEKLTKAGANAEEAAPIGAQQSSLLQEG